jgi:hypothetical protein
VVGEGGRACRVCDVAMMIDARRSTSADVVKLAHGQSLRPTQTRTTEAT